MRVREALAAAAARLAATSDTPRLDAEVLMAHALGLEREEMLLIAGERPVPTGYEALIERRLVHEPIAYIVGARDFWTLRIGVSPDVLIPRPDSETLIDAAIAHFEGRSPGRVLDLGTGSGALLLAALSHWPAATGIGTDSSEYALNVAVWNANRLGLAGRSRWHWCDWDEGLDERFDLILCNPPYVEEGAALPPDVARFEPAAALYAGADGLDAYRRLAPRLPRLLAPGGIVCVEIGAGQEGAVRALVEAEGFTVESRTDLNGVVRCLVLRPDLD